MEDELARRLGNVILYYLYEYQIKDPDMIAGLVIESHKGAIEHLIKELTLVLPVSEADWKKKMPS